MNKARSTDDRPGGDDVNQGRELRGTPRPSIRSSWVPVTDPQGRTRMEMRWHVGQDGRTSHPAPAAA